MVSNKLYFASGRDIHNLFRSNGQDVPTDALESLKNQLSLKPGEYSVSLQDSRIILVKEWLELSPGAQDIFIVLDRRLQVAVDGHCLSILTSLVTITSQHLVYQSLGHPIVKTLLSPRWLRKLHSHLSGGQLEICLASLRLLNSLSTFAAGKEQKNLLESFAWDLRVFQKLLRMRKREKDAKHDVLSRPDIRTSSLQLILSFVSSSSYLKAMFLEHRRDIFLTIFKGMDGDQPSVVRYVLETLWSQLWQDQKLRKTVKVASFGEKTIQQLLKLYDRSEQEGSHPENVPANIVHHFLLAICTHRGVGICFADNGWYPRQVNEGEARDGGNTIHNKILANVLKMLKVHDDVRQQELALRVLSSCPELVAGYLQFLAPTLEPRLSSKWLASVAFFGAIVSLPVPIDSFHFLSTTSSSNKAQPLYRPDPPPLSIIINNITPSPTLKMHLTKALHSSYSLLQHSAGVLLAQCLLKCESVQDAFRTIKGVLAEDETEGQWSRRLGDIDREVRKRLPDVNVVIAFASAHQLAMAPTIKASMLSELSQRLLWMYHRCAPSLIVEATYDSSKSLRTLIDVDEGRLPASSAMQGFNRLRQLHTLRMLTESDQFIWDLKTAPSGPSNVYILLELFLFARHPSIRQATTKFLSQALQDSLLFQHDPGELHIWLDALPATVRSSDAEAPDGARLADERQCVISFLEACMQRCTKTPHRYLEELESLVGTSDVTSHSLSPIIATIVEQLHAKIRGKILEPSDTLSLTTFFRKAIVGLLGRQSDTGIFHAISAKLKSIVTGSGAFSEFPTITVALRKECDILDNCLSWCASKSPSKVATTGMSTSDTVMSFVSRVEKHRSEMEGQSPVIQAYELVEWIRLLDHPLTSAIVDQTAAVVKRLHAPALTSFCLHLSPVSGFLWALPEDDISSWVPTDWIILNWDQKFVTWARFASVMETALRKHRRTLHQYKVLVGLILHRLRHWHDSNDAIPMLEALVILLESAKNELPPPEFTALKYFGMSERRELRHLACALEPSVEMVSALERLQGCVIDPSSESDHLLVSSICAHWVGIFSATFKLSSWQNLAGSHIWIKFMSPNDLLAVTEELLKSLQDLHVVLAKTLPLQIVDALLKALACCRDKNDFSIWMREHVMSFIALRNLLPRTTALDQIILHCVDTGPLSGYGVFMPDGCTLQQAIDVTEVYWESLLSPLPQRASVTSLLTDKEWSLNHSRAVASFIHRSPVARRSFWSWLCSDPLDEKPAIFELAPAIHAVLDASTSAEFLSLEKEDVATVSSLFRGMAKEFFKGRDTLYGSCLEKMISHFRFHRADFVEVLSEGITSLPAHTLHLQSLYLVHRLVDVFECAPFAEAAVGHGLQWAVQHLSETRSRYLNACSIATLTDVVRLSTNIDIHYAELVLTVAIRHHVYSTSSMHLAEALLSKVALKPASVNRFIQSILQHVDFVRLASLDSVSDEREAVSKVLATLFLAHPANTCQPSHAQSLVKMYSGSMSSADRRILAIFRLFEEQQQASVASIIAQWSHSKSPDQGTTLDAILSLDPPRVFRTCLSFPDGRALSDEDENIAPLPEYASLYDSVFVLLLFAQMQLGCPPKSALSWVSVYRTNVVCLIIRCLSSTDHAVRRIATLQLDGLYNVMQEVDMQEKPHVIQILDMCRDLLEKAPDHREVTRLPSYTTLLFAHALRSIFYPANFIYPHTARFLLQRPQIDIRDLPLLYSMLYGNRDDWKKERGWIVRFLADGMQSNDDWRLLKRRHAWDLLASMFQGSYDDTPLRHSILEFLANLTCQQRPATFLVLRSSLVHWIESQLLEMKYDESTAWAKIVENILVVVDMSRIEPATKDRIQNGLLRCLSNLISKSDLALLRLVSRALARLDGDNLSASSIKNAVDLAFERLRTFERSNVMPLHTDVDYHAIGKRNSYPPHHGLGLHRPLFESNIETWGRTVEKLWSVSFMHGIFEPTWYRLTGRLLLWRACVGVRESPIGEWARLQSLHYFWHRDGNNV